MKELHPCLQQSPFYFCWAGFYYSLLELTLENRLLQGGMMATSQRPALRVTWIRDDGAHDEVRYRVEVFGKDARVFDVRISLLAKAQAKPSPEEKIELWYKHNPLVLAGASEKIPDDHFSSH